MSIEQGSNLGRSNLAISQTKTQIKAKAELCHAREEVCNRNANGKEKSPCSQGLFVARNGRSYLLILVGALAHAAHIEFVIAGRDLEERGVLRSFFDVGEVAGD